uniref:non-specific serine/threonine protein kinase n=1 Tax=Elaeophora elaphi TaxID=1147741 RepID=A0A0R3RH83_9BILA
MSSEVTAPMSVESDSSRWRTVSMTVGGDDCEDETEVNDLRESLRAWSSLASPSSSANDHPMIEFSPECDSDFDAVLNSVFAEKNRLFQPLSDDTFVEEVFVEKKPKILHGYLFGERIGEGSYGKVKEVLEQDTLVRRAVKIIKEARLRKIPNGHANVEQELRILKRVRHRNVIALHDFFRVDDKQKLYMILEYCIGSMQQILDGSREKKLPEYQAQYFFRQLCDGLSYLHAHGVIHKDIKPGNLLVTLDGTLKISDFGVAEMLDPFQAEDWCTVVQGTPKFQPPEIVSGTSENYRGRKVDIWACGVTLYNMVSGEYPFEGDVIMRLFDNIANQPLQMPLSVQLSRPLEYLLTAMLDKDPEKRINMHDIRRCEWYTERVDADELHRVPISACNNVPAHRPLSIYVQLDQLYGSALEEDDGSRSSEYPRNMVSAVIIEPSLEDRNVGEQISLNETKRNRSILSMCIGLSRSP